MSNTSKFVVVTLAILAVFGTYAALFFFVPKIAMIVLISGFLILLAIEIAAFLVFGI